MILSGQTYPEYKKIDLPWLDEIPTHWKMKRGKSIFKPIDIRSTTGNEELLTVSSRYGVIQRKNATVTMFKAASYFGYKLCWPDDLVINSLWAWANGLGISNDHGIISSAYGVYRIKNKDLISPRYIHYLVRSIPFQWELQVRSKGIWTSRLQLTDESFLDAPFPLPPLEEQKAIVRYLDYVDQLIKRYMRAKQKLIKLLNEQKQAIIHQAVTRGLDPNVRLKPSGIEWLGDIPEHWVIYKIKQVARLNPPHSNSIRKYDPKELVVFLPMENVSVWGEINTSQRKPIQEVRQGFTHFNRGDVVIAKITPCFENGKGACLSDLPTEIGFGTTEFIVLRPGRNVSSKFLYLITALTQFRKLGIESMTGSAGQQRISREFVENYIFGLPSLEEQNEIFHFVEKIRSEFAISTNQTQYEISLLQEYRARLIADVVTGKLDIRSTAAQLPEGLAALEPIEEEEILEGESLEEPELDVDEGEA
jgi:type I restriction enzyme S subunit